MLAGGPGAARSGCSRDLRRGAASGVTGDGRRPSVSVVVPARDEAATLPALLALAAPTSRRPPRRGRRGRRRLARRRPPRWPRAAAPRSLAASPPAGLDRQGVGLPASGADADDAATCCSSWTPTPCWSRTRSTACSSCTTRTAAWCRCSPSTESSAPYEQLSSYFNVVALLASGGLLAAAAADGPMAFGPCLLTSRARLRAGRWPRRGARRDPRRRRARGGLRPGGAAGALRGRRHVDHDAQLPRRACASWPTGWTKNFASGASAAAPRRPGGAGALDQRPPRGRGRRGRSRLAPPSGWDRRRWPSAPARCGRPPGWSWRCSCAGSCGASAPSAGGPGCSSRCRCSPSTCSSPARRS